MLKELEKELGEEEYKAAYDKATDLSQAVFINIPWDNLNDFRTYEPRGYPYFQNECREKLQIEKFSVEQETREVMEILRFGTFAPNYHGKQISCANNSPSAEAAASNGGGSGGGKKTDKKTDKKGKNSEPEVAPVEVDGQTKDAISAHFAEGSASESENADSAADGHLFTFVSSVVQSAVAECKTSCRALTRIKKELAIDDKVVEEIVKKAYLG
jgi:hypothetical protein